MKIFFVIVLVVGGGWWIQQQFFGEKNQSQVEPQSNESLVVSEVNEVVGQAFTMTQVAEHKDQSSCYTVIRGMVYDVSAFIDKHPGGDKNILRTCGIDATTLFEGKHGGQEKPEAALAGFVIGRLAE